MGDRGRLNLSEEGEDKRVGYAEVLAHRNFLALWTGSLVGRTGDYLLSVAMIAFVVARTDNGFDAGLMAAVFYIPIFLFAPLFGRIVDNNDRRRLLVVSTLMEVFFGILLYLAVKENFLVLPLSFALVFVISAFGLMVSICRSSSIPLTVSRDELTAANSLQQTTSQFSRIFGYAAGGVLFIVLGETSGLVLLVVISFIISASVFSLMRFESPVAEGRGRRSADGLKYIKGNRLFLQITVFLTIVNFTGAGMLFLPAIMSSRIFLTGETGYASILLVLAVGSIAGNYLVTVFRVRDRVGSIMILSVMANGILYIMFAYSPGIIAALAVTLVIGVVEGISAVPFVALLQARTPPERMGSVLAGISMLLLGGASLSMVLSGELVVLMGVQRVYVLFAALLLAVSLLGANMKELRQASY